MIAASERVIIDTPSVIGSINLLGARFDDLRLKSYRETIDPKSPIITLLSPAGAPAAYYAVFGWGRGSRKRRSPCPIANQWRPETSNALARASPSRSRGITARLYLPPQGRDRRKISVHDHRHGRKPVGQAGDAESLWPDLAHETPKTAGFYILHEGLIGVFGDEGLKKSTMPI